MPKNPKRPKRRQKRTIVGPCVDVPFGDVIRQAFAESGLTQQQFADRLGVRQPRIVEIFSSTSITEALFDRCVAALGLVLEVRLVEVAA
jgi:plasmid maintenance system antidote protein VapI